jgi:hypothetical protein
MRALLEGLEEAFAFFGGVPQELLFDQMKSVITKDGRLNGEKLVTNAEFIRFAAHWDFKVRACKAYRAQTKGKVERPISYVRSSFIYGREFISDGDVDKQLCRWLDHTANVRIHRTVQEQPILRFERDERALLQPLPARTYHSIVVDRAPRRTTKILMPRVPEIVVERRPLARYAELVGGAR